MDENKQNPLTLSFNLFNTTTNKNNYYNSSLNTTLTLVSLSLCHTSKTSQTTSFTQSTFLLQRRSCSPSFSFAVPIYNSVHPASVSDPISLFLRTLCPPPPPPPSSPVSATLPGSGACWRVGSPGVQQHGQQVIRISGKVELEVWKSLSSVCSCGKCGAGDAGKNSPDFQIQRSAQPKAQNALALFTVTFWGVATD